MQLSAKELQIKSLLIRHNKLGREIKLRKKRVPTDFIRPQNNEILNQEGLWLSRKQQRLVLGGNKAGKTIMGAAYVIEFCRQNPGKSVLCATIANLQKTVQMAKIYELIPKTHDIIKYIRYTSERGFANKQITFINGSTIWFKTYDQGADSFQGTAFDLIWFDEEPPYDIYKESLVRLVDRNGFMNITMTPTKGVTWVDKELVRPLQKNNLHGKKQRTLVDVFYWNNTGNNFVNQAALKTIMGQLSAKEAFMRTTGQIVDIGSGKIYYDYDQSIHRKPININPNYPLHLSFDFNVSPMTTTIFQDLPGDPKKNEQDRVIYCFKVIQSDDYNTELQATDIIGQLRDWKGDIIIEGDASGSQRHTESAKANETNWTILKKRFEEYNTIQIAKGYAQSVEFNVPTKNANIMERTQWGNSKFKDSTGRVGFYLNDQYCEELEDDFQKCKWSERKKYTKDDKDKRRNHSSDTFDYHIAANFKMEQSAFASVTTIPYEEAVKEKISLVI